jgi:hypothetical protein
MSGNYWSRHRLVVWAESGCHIFMEDEGTMIQPPQLLSLNGFFQFIRHHAAALIFSPLKK